MKINAEITEMMMERFGHDNLIALATLDGDIPSVRTVNAYYEDGSFYVVTHALSGKMQQIEKNPKVAVCGDWFTARGIGESMGHILRRENTALADKLRNAFAAWYDNGHTNEADPHTIILRIRLTEGVLFHHGKRYDITF
ncbi:MAG: pyridoxamine 5'-phosphate oxidase family protein [Clostridia bacterium]|nr:pyridoxamine 5'-phosphate oxidase family protein [Clostridia bacterium]